MPKIEQFEDLLSWRKARELASRIREMTDKPTFARDFALRDQILRSSASVMDNIAEGFEAGSDREFARFLRIARRSAGETQSQLYLALDRGHITETQRSAAHDLATEVKKLINGMIGYLTRHQATK
jgi:four helix bundle protein